MANQVKYSLKGGVFILIANLFLQNDWGIPLISAIVFVIGGITLPSLITFMSDKKKDHRYK
ncbi:MAG TPA: hypothetical protein VK048_02875 [Atopostipes sp.]|nr:hypothetical protein [Atopostipes sp.]